MPNNKNKHIVILLSITIVVLVCIIAILVSHRAGPQDGGLGLEKIIQENPGYAIKSCNYNGSTYYFSMHAIGGGSYIYDSEGRQIAHSSIGINQNGESNGVFSEEQKNISKTCKSTVYEPNRDIVN